MRPKHDPALSKSQNERAQAQLRFAAHYLGLLQGYGQRVYDDDFDDGARVLYDLNAENIEAALFWIAGAQEMPERRRDLSVQFGGMGANILHERMTIDQRRYLYSQFLENARGAQNVQVTAILVDLLGLEEFAAGNWSRAEECHLEAIRLTHQLNTPERTIGVWGHLGIVHEAQGQFDQARSDFSKQHRLAREAGDLRQEGAAIGNLAVLDFEAGNFERSLERHRTSYALHAQVGHRDGMLRALNGIGNAASEIGEFETAEEAYLALIHEEVVQTDKDTLSAAKNGLGRLYQLADRPDESITLLREGIQLTEELGDRRGQGACLTNLANVLLATGQPEEAFLAIQKRLKIAQDMDDHWGIAVALEARGRTHIELQNTELALGDLQKAEVAWQALTNDRSRVIAMLHQGVAQARVGMWAEAVGHFERALQAATDKGFDVLVRSASKHLETVHTAQAQDNHPPGDSGFRVLSWLRMKCGRMFGIFRK
ncbi:MAG: tetratricopeptide repeat protein [Pelagimonas sp.]|uniref:tetratricopeptide repeat protein n=1 Tax=Pelagimonas sp. TaxID=2073170 RepID=UPI003D6A6BF4